MCAIVAELDTKWTWLESRSILCQRTLQQLFVFYQKNTIVRSEYNSQVRYIFCLLLVPCNPVLPAAEPPLPCGCFGRSEGYGSKPLQKIRSRAP